MPSLFALQRGQAFAEKARKIEQLKQARLRCSSQRNFQQAIACLEAQIADEKR